MDRIVSASEVLNSAGGLKCFPFAILPHQTPNNKQSADGERVPTKLRFLVSHSIYYFCVMKEAKSLFSLFPFL